MNICKDLREALGLTVSALSKESKMSMNTLRLYEAGGGITSKSIAKLANYFEVSADELDGKKPFDIEAWLKPRNIGANEEVSQTETVAPASIHQELQLHQRGIVQIIKTSNAAANYYLEAGWILIDTAPMKDEDGFYCLLGSTKTFNQDDFVAIKKTKKTPPKSYWMQRP